MKTRVISFSLAAALAAGLASMPLSAAAAGVRICTFPGSPTTGLDTSVAREVFRAAGMTASFSEQGLQDGGGDDGVSARQVTRTLDRNCDVIAGFPVSPVTNGSGDGEMVFSQGYLQSSYVSIAAHGAGKTNKAGETVIAATYSSPSQMIAIQQTRDPLHAHFDLENTPEATIEAVAKGRAQRAIVWYPSVVAYEHEHPQRHFDVTATVSAYSNWNLVFAFSGKNAALQQRVDAALSTLHDNGQLATLTRGWALPGNAAAADATPKLSARRPRDGVRLAGYSPSVSRGGFIKVSDSAAGHSVPSFDADQVKHGKALYADSCAKCHGAKLEGNVAPALGGAAFAPAANSHLTVGGIYQYMASNMPADKPGQMKDEDYADLMAYLLYANGYDAGKAHLDATTAGASTVPLNAGPAGARE